MVTPEFYKFTKNPFFRLCKESKLMVAREFYKFTRYIFSLTHCTFYLTNFFVLKNFFLRIQIQQRHNCNLSVQCTPLSRPCHPPTRRTIKSTGYATQPIPPINVIFTIQKSSADYGGALDVGQGKQDTAINP